MFANGNFSSEAQTVKASEGPSYRAGRDKQKYTASAGPGPGPGPAHSAASSSANALCCALKRGPQECSGANRHRRRTRSDRAAGLDLISEEHRPVGERLNYGADKAEPDQGPKRLVLSVELDVVTYAAVQKTNTDVLEGRPFFRGFGFALKAGQDPDGSLEPFPHDWVWFVLLSPGDAEIRRSQERKEPVRRALLVQLEKETSGPFPCYTESVLGRLIQRG